MSIRRIKDIVCEYFRDIKRRSQTPRKLNTRINPWIRRYRLSFQSFGFCQYGVFIHMIRRIQQTDPYLDTFYRTLEAKNIDEYWWRKYKSGDLEVLES
ncbi:hypothetical protein Tco_1532418 [Tanacetum coccineum]